MDTSMTGSEAHHPPYLQADQFLVLLVDDVANNLKILRSILSPQGYRLTFASDGAQAIERARSASPNLILLDLMMPDTDGIQVAQVLKSDPKLSTIPIIFLTASQDLEHLVQAFANGAVDYLTKPFRTDELLARVKTHLELNALRQQTHRQMLKEVVLRQMIQDIHSSLNLDDMLGRLIVSMQHLIDADTMMFCRRESPGQYRVVAAAQAPDVLRSDIVPSLDSDGATLEVEISFPHALDTPYFSRHSSSLSLSQHQFLDQFQAESAYWISVGSAVQEWGALIACYRNQPESRRHDGDDVLIRVAEQIAIAIQQAELLQNLQVAHTHLKKTVNQLEYANQELEKLAHVDGLTQIANRRYLDSYLQREWLRLRREKLPLSVILCDVDYFKQYNDCYGHLAGDQCLRAIAQTLSQTLRRPADLMARYGGEEMMAVLPNTAMEGAIEVVQSMQRAIQSLAIPHESVPQPQKILSLSFGVACIVPPHDLSIENLIDAADQALYFSKHNGRNQYTMVSYCDRAWSIPYPSVD